MKNLKRLCALMLVFASILFLSVDAFAFTDVDSSDYYYKAISELSSKGVINGYADGSFKVYNQITRAEVAVILAKAFNYDDASATTSFKDVKAVSWFYEPVMKVVNKNIMSGVGDGFFKPQSNIRENELMKVAVSILGLDEYAIKAGAWPDGYRSVAQDIGIYSYAGDGNKFLSRGEVAFIVHNILTYKELMNADESNGLVLGGKKCYIGMSSSEFGSPDEVLNSKYKDASWYVYGTNDYDNFYAVLAKNDLAIGFLSSGNGFKYKNYKAGDTTSEDIPELDKDKNDGNIIHALYYVPKSVDYDQDRHDYSGEENINFHLVNAFRKFHGLNTLRWDERLAETARRHSEDMLKRGYFNHISPEGKSPFDRMKDMGITYYSAAENIAYNYADGFASYSGWVNSKGHRDNILYPSYNRLGVGIACDGSLYATQNFIGR